jgi:hypothetical protein
MDEPGLESWVDVLLRNAAERTVPECSPPKRAFCTDDEVSTVCLPCREALLKSNRIAASGRMVVCGLGIRWPRVVEWMRDANLSCL